MHKGDAADDGYAMRPLKRIKTKDGQIRLELPLRGGDLIRHPQLNKGTAFTPQERDDFHLHGLLPHATNTLEQQVQRIDEKLDRILLNGRHLSP